MFSSSRPLAVPSPVRGTPPAVFMVDVNDNRRTSEDPQAIFDKFGTEFGIGKDVTKYMVRVFEMKSIQDSFSILPMIMIWPQW